MAGTGMGIEVRMPRRRAVVNLSKYVAEHYNKPEGEQECFVLATLQWSNGIYAEPVFVCELLDGSVINALTEAVRFVDTDGGVLK